MTRAKLTILAATTWAVGFFSVGALAYSYSGPARPAPDAVTAVVIHHRITKDAVAAPPLAKITTKTPRLTKVVAPKPPPPVVVRMRAPTPPPIPTQHCAGWQDMGPGSSVRICD
jgi:hypothetical protein